MFEVEFSVSIMYVRRSWNLKILETYFLLTCPNYNRIQVLVSVIVFRSDVLFITIDSVLNLN